MNWLHDQKHPEMGQHHLTSSLTKATHGRKTLDRIWSGGASPVSHTILKKFGCDYSPVLGAAAPLPGRRRAVGQVPREDMAHPSSRRPRRRRHQLRTRPAGEARRLGGARPQGVRLLRAYRAGVDPCRPVPLDATPGRPSTQSLGSSSTSATRVGVLVRFGWVVDQGSPCRCSLRLRAGQQGRA